MTSPSVGVLNEGPLHASLKEWYRRPGDVVEQPLEGFVIDLVRSGMLIEIQTGGFSSMRRKFDHLLDRHPVLLVHPVATEKHIVKLDDEGGVVSRRKSPRRGAAVDVCSELVSFPSLLSHPNFTLEVVLASEEEVLREDSAKGWRRGGWVVEERRLVEVVNRVLFEFPQDLLQLVPPDMADSFTTADLDTALGRPRRLAQELAYCLSTSDAIESIGRDRRGVLYRAPSH